MATRGTRGALAVLMMTAAMTGSGWAQEDGVWVQIEALPTLAQAQQRARLYANNLPDVNGYFLGGRWYGVALGPYAPDDATRVLNQLRARDAIPDDSYIVDGDRFRTQFYPVGTGAQTAPRDLPDGIEATAPEAAPQTATATSEPPTLRPAPDETVGEARASEALLDRAEREAIQIALQWAGVYTAGIDGAFGRGTRAAMAAWQEANRYEPTGVLTTAQRAQLFAQYNAVLDGMDLQVVRDDAAGIEMLIPTGVVAFEAYAPPFARFTATGEIDATVLLISQPGDQDRLFGLYEILQTLEIIPAEGPRSRQQSGFVIEGIDGDRQSYVTASLQDGEIKGFALVWPAGDEERRSRILSEMQASFTRIDGVLDPRLVPPDEEQSVDLVSGLAIRTPLKERSGFYIGRDGTVLTATEAVDGCAEIVLDGAHAAEEIYRDPALGISVLRTEERLAPRAIARFQTGVPRIQAEIAVAGYPYGGLLSAPAITFGTLADIRGLDGEDEVKRLDIAAQPGDVGGPVLDNGGAVLGMLMPRQADGARLLPPEVSYSVDAGEIVASLDAADISHAVTSSVAAITPERLTRSAGGITVLVSCWE